MKRRRIHGFTLVEIAVVITVLAIITGLVLVTYNKAQADARDTKRVSDMLILKTRIDKYIATNNEPPDQNDDTFFQPLRDAGFTDPLDNPNWNYIGRNTTTRYCTTSIRWGGGEGNLGPSCRNYAYVSGSSGTGFSDNGKYFTGCYVMSKSSRPWYILMRYDEASHTIKYYGDPNDVRVYKNAEPVAFPGQVCELSEI